MIATEFFNLAMAFSLGLLGSIHCLGMCGGIACLMSVRQNTDVIASVGVTRLPVINRLQPLLMYNAGRVSSYALMGLLVGLGSQWLVDQWQGLGLALRTVAGVLLVLMGLYVAGISRLITVLESGLARVLGPDRLFARGSMSTMPVFIYGLVWGWLPCGLVYSSVVWASASAQSPVDTAVLMLLFGFGTLPAMLATGLFAEGLRRLLQLQAIRLVAGLSIVLYGVWTLLGAFSHAGHAGHESHGAGSHQHHRHHMDMQH